MPIKFNDNTQTWELVPDQDNVIPEEIHNEVKKAKAKVVESTAETIIVEGIKLKADDSRITTDLISGKKTIKDNCIKIFTDIENNEFGYTRHNKKCPMGVHNKLEKIYAINPNVFINAGMSESFMNGLFWSTSNFNNTYTDYRKFENSCNLEDPYEYGALSKTFLLTEGKPYTFGVELEFSKLYIPEYISSKYNMKCVRDGSLNQKQGGPEIVTGVLKGDSGLNHLQEICIELAKRGTIDEFCGIHIHIGGFNVTKEFITLAYILGNKLENEIASIMPPTRRQNEYCRSIKTNFTKKSFVKETRDRQMELDEYYLKIYHWLAHEQLQGHPANALDRKRNHPMGSKCNYDHSTPRYCWLNLIPLAFNTRGDESYTIEFRNHSGSSNFTKIYNWIKICMAFVNFIENHRERILTQDITLQNIIQEAYPKSWMSLDNYIETRKIKFASANAMHEEKKEYKEGCDKKKSVKELLKECV